jgi:hypothetical protein
MRRLRQKLEVDPDHPVYLETIRGSGYRLRRVGAEEPTVEAAESRAEAPALADGERAGG